MKVKYKNGTDVILNILSNVIDDSNDETIFIVKLLLTDRRQVSRLRKAFVNKSSADIILQRTGGCIL